MRSVLDIILLVLQIYIWLLIAAAVLSWLIAFNVVNARNQVVATIADHPRGHRNLLLRKRLEAGPADRPSA